MFLYGHDVVHQLHTGRSQLAPAALMEITAAQALIFNGAAFCVSGRRVSGPYRSSRVWDPV